VADTSYSGNYSSVKQTPLLNEKLLKVSYTTLVLSKSVADELTGDKPESNRTAEHNDYSAESAVNNPYFCRAGYHGHVANVADE
jgi:hypothetical protein